MAVDEGLWRARIQAGGAARLLNGRGALDLDTCGKSRVVYRCYTSTVTRQSLCSVSMGGL